MSRSFRRRRTPETIILSSIGHKDALRLYGDLANLT